MNTEKLTRPEELMLCTQISCAANAMNWSDDSAAVAMASVGKLILDLKEESDNFNDDLAETGMTKAQADQAIRLYKAFPEILTDEFIIGGSNPVNFALRVHEYNPSKVLLDNLISFIESHPDSKE
jgi:hypothetical protein